MPDKPEILTANIIASSRLFAIEALHLQFANGQQRHYERLAASKHDAVMIVPLLDDETILLVREYAAGIEDYHLGFPKGIVEQGEDMLAAANRELMEEVGYGAHHLTLIKKLSLSPGYMDRPMGLVLARDLYVQKLVGDEPEEIEVIPWRLDDVDKLLARQDFHEARSIAALFMIRELIKR